MSWVPAETLAEGPTPEARIGHTAVYDPDSGRIFVFGGSKNKKWFNDVHILDTQSWKWTMVEVQNTFVLPYWQVAFSLHQSFTYINRCMICRFSVTP